MTDWKHHGVRVVRASELDPNVPQTQGMSRAAAVNFARMGAEKIWAGTVNIKANAKTRRGAARRSAAEGNAPARVLPIVRPSRDDPPLLAVVDAFIDADARLFASSPASLDLGFVFERHH